MIQSIIATTALVGFLAVLALGTVALTMIDKYCDKFREH